MSRRRQVVFGASVAIAGVAISTLCLVPSFVHVPESRSLFADPLQEAFFFDMVGWISGCWLLSWISAFCDWKGMARVGQWLAIILLCVEQVVLIGVFRGLSAYPQFVAGGFWLAPALLEAYFIGYFLSIFTMPALTMSGRTTLTGLGTLAVLLPWLLGRDAVILGTQVLYGACFQSSSPYL